MIICDACKRDPLEHVANAALKTQPWGVVLTPPAGSGFAEKRLCWVCTMRVFDRWLQDLELEPLHTKPK
jgi:hypothetical protein